MTERLKLVIKIVNMMVNNMVTLSKVNNYVKETISKVNNKYRLKYHMVPPVGWMNDPNGLVYFNNCFHVYYQYNPFNSLPGRMLWGHFKSKDLIKYEHEDVAIVPNEEHGNIFSGGAIEDENVINVTITLQPERDIQYINYRVVRNKESLFKNELIDAINDSYKRLISPSIEREIRTILTEKAQEQAISIFSLNLKNLLLQPRHLHIRLLPNYSQRSFV